jgi:hypothetical protein
MHIMMGENYQPEVVCFNGKESVQFQALVIIICSGQHRKISNKLRYPQYKYKMQI